MSEEKKESGGGLSNLTVRLLTAAVLVPVLIALIAWSRHEGWWGLVFLASALGAAEILGMAVPDPRWPDFVVGLGAALALGSTLYWCPHPQAPIVVGAFAVVGTLLYSMLWPRQMDKAGPRTAGLFLTVFYAGLLFPFVALLKRLPDGSDWVFLLCTVTFFGDSGAYFVGRFLGKHKLYPAVSPKKTWEGGVGGLAFSVGAGVLAHFWYMPQLSWGHLFAICVPAAVLGQAGDFSESLLKRSFGVKDSGQILPGHGGIMDRVDALVFAAPFMYCYGIYVFYA